MPKFAKSHGDTEADWIIIEEATGEVRGAFTREGDADTFLAALNATDESLRLCCGNCGEPGLQYPAWIEAGTEAKLDSDESYNGYWCSSCETHNVSGK